LTTAKAIYLANRARIGRYYSMPNQTTHYLQGLENIVQQYDAFIFDIWGTLHNGQKIFPTVLPVLHALKEKNKLVSFLSNSPSRIDAVTARLNSSYNITPDLYHTAFNSGESSYIALRDRHDDWHQRLGTRYYFIYADNHLDNYADLPYERVENIEDAEFIILSKTLDYSETVQDYDVRFNEATQRGLPMLCANPDRIVGIGDTLFVCPGTVAAYYETMGGNVYYHGKPHAKVYEQLHAMIGADIDPKRILAVGDAFETDILGGNRFGCDTLLLQSGIHAPDIHPQNPIPDIERLAQQYGAMPSYFMDQLRW
jgi:HAD superfamily hydrolase (TIGR01459 family)